MKLIEGVIRISNQSLDAYGEEFASYTGVMTFECYVIWRMQGWEPSNRERSETTSIRHLREVERAEVTTRLSELHKQHAAASKAGFGQLHATEIMRLERAVRAL